MAEDDGDCVDLEPFFYDEAAAEVGGGGKETGGASASTIPWRRRLVLCDAIYIEVDLKMKMDDRRGSSREDKRLSKGLLILNGVQLSPYLSKMRTAVQSLTLRSRSICPCNAQITYSYVSHGVEATISVVELLLDDQGHGGGHFCGQITACTSTIQDTSVVLHDSKLLAAAAGVIAADDCNVHTSIPLLRRVMAVSLDETLIVTIFAQSSDGVTDRQTIDFKPAVNGGDEARIVCGVTSFVVKVIWSTMSMVPDQ
uniref:DUF6598 domain-containing protein n=1 Tax=Leersia perrieri TaxID=77586 RepID=A0A0D9Y1W0_9ORYZ